MPRRRLVTVLALAGIAAALAAAGSPAGATYGAAGGDGPAAARTVPAGAPTASGTVPGSGPPGTGKPAGVPAAKPDHLLFTVRHSGDPRTDGTYALQCHPAAGGHPAPQAACAALDAAAHGGADPFAPVPSGAHCAMIHGGPATAQVRGIWHGRPVFARFDRSDGCAMSRWDALVPALPAIR